MMKEIQLLVVAIIEGLKNQHIGLSIVYLTTCFVRCKEEALGSFQMYSTSIFQDKNVTLEYMPYTIGPKK